MQRLLSRRLAVSRVPTIRNSTRAQVITPRDFRRISSRASVERFGAPSSALLERAVDTRIRYFSEQASNDEESLCPDASRKLEGQDRGYSFRNDLSNWYRVNHDVSLNDAFVTDYIPQLEKGPSSSQAWTCTFICPVTGEQIHAGKVSGPVPGREVDGRWYYTKKRFALEAAAMKALDSSHFGRATTARSYLTVWYMTHHKTKITYSMFNIRKKNMIGKEHGGTHCWTASFTCPISGQVYAAPEIPDIEATYSDEEGCWYFKKKGDAINAAATGALDAKKVEEAGSPQIGSSSGIAESSRKSLAEWAQWYKERHDITISDTEHFVASKTPVKGAFGGNRWTASFICPVTGDRFDSGSLSKSTVTADSDGLNWYLKKEDAIVAAALCALDTIRFKETGAKETRYCEEDPSGHNTARSLQPLSNSSSDEEDDLKQSANDVQPLEFSVDDVESFEEDEEYVIEIIPQRVGTSGGVTSGVSTTLDLVTETWMELTRLSDTENLKKPRLRSPETERKQAIDRASAWIVQQREKSRVEEPSERTQFDNQGQMSSRNIANLILASMASAHQRLPFHGEPSGVEDTAKKMFDFMWSSPSTAPDSNSYAAYIKCLEGDDPTDIAERAQNIFDAMSKGLEFEGRMLPRPNVSVYNSLLQRRAEARIKTSLPDLESGIEPNRDTFLSILSSIAHSSGDADRTSGFDAEYALTCIAHMKHLSESRSDRSLRPDIDVFNAPLRWSAGLLSESSRSYSRCTGWDAYDNIFRQGFRQMSNTSSLVQEAYAIEKWYESIKNNELGSDIRPNVETYESVIQAWVRTGTHEGLQKAEALAEIMIENHSDELQLRLQTFHPIVAALIYSGADENRSKVDYWMGKLQSLLPEFTQDGRFCVAPILARVASQKHTLEAVSNKGSESPSSSSDGIEILEERATECSHLLDVMIAGLNAQNNFFLEGDAFMLTIQAWHNAGVIHSREGSLDKVDTAKSAIQRTIEAFDGLVASVNLSDDGSLSTQLLHLVNSSPAVYSTALSALEDLGSVDHVRRAGRDIAPLLNQRLDGLEEKIRRSEEFRVFLHQNLAAVQSSESLQSTDEIGGRIIYEDMFAYPYEAFLRHPPSKTWGGVYTLVVQALNEGFLYPNKRNSDIVRICILISDLLIMEKGASFDSKSSLYESILQVLKRMGGEPNEQDALIDRVTRDMETMILRQKGVLKSKMNAGLNEDSTDTKTSKVTRGAVPSGSRFRRRGSRGIQKGSRRDIRRQKQTC